MLRILGLHTTDATTGYEQAIYYCQAKCVDESWMCDDGNLENVVEAPCLTVRLLAAPYADLPGFPDALSLPAEVPIAAQLVDDVIAAIRARRGNAQLGFPYETLADRYPAELVLTLMEELSDADILEYGVSLRTAWVQDYVPDLDKRIAAFKAERCTPAG